ncbi:MAG: TonB-dependent receptor [Bacteroidia bacterium]|nr:TonB-dependent receptor [Bacteroidia bacterium]
MDAEGNYGLPGANIILINSDPLVGTTTNAEGEFELLNIPVGRQSFKVSYLGYKPVIMPEVMVSTGKQTFLTFELYEEVITAREVVIKATVDKDKPLNSMAMISARSFNVDESRRYAGTADDPMRAAANFAGVASSPDVNSNQIVVRGNSPKGLLWKVDGLEIPNPNHFAYVGHSGGGITMFSSQLLANSDFYTAAFPAEFGNALSGVFDIRFRNGNNFKREYAVQIGIMGLDLSAEGPFRKGGQSSYLFNYRYSILAFLQLINPDMKNKIPSYQDLSFKINLPTKKAGTFSVFGIGGLSKSHFYPVEDSTEWHGLDERTNSTLNNTMGAIGVTHRYTFSRKTYLSTSLSSTYSQIYFTRAFLDSAYQLDPYDHVNHVNYRHNIVSRLNHKFGPKHTNKTGIQYSYIGYNLNIKAMNPFTGLFGTINQGVGHTSMIQAFSESRFDLTNTLHFEAGLHMQYLFLNSDWSIEPRLALRWSFNPRQSIGLGYGNHAQMEDIGVYLAEEKINPTNILQPNKGLRFSRAHHFVLEYNFSIRTDMRIKVETYYQSLYNIPDIPGTYFSMINSMGDYLNDTLENTGTGYNYGVDLTFEKFLSKGYYYLATVSLFNSRYKGGDGIERNTKFNSGYVVNILGGKEFTIRKKNILGINLKATLTGGEYYVPIDLQASILQGREVLNDALAYTEKYSDFYYLDMTLTYKTNHKKFSGIWAIQVKNMLNQRPVIGYQYNMFNQQIEEVKGMGFLPIISYKIEF